MAKAARPSEGELEILKVLWNCGECTVQQVHEVIAAKRETGYTTVLKLMQIMLSKRLVTRDDSRRQHVYRAAMPEADTKRHLVGDLLERAFSGSAHNLILHALSAKKASRKELQQIRDLIDSMEEGTRR